jgi:hypothetical protein
MAAEATDKKVYFDCAELVAACDAEVAAGGPNPLGRIFQIEDKMRDGRENSKFATATATLGSKTGPLRVRIKNEKHVGKNAPYLAKDLAAHNESLHKNAEKAKEPRGDKHPTLNFQKYQVNVEDDEAGNLVGTEPGPEHQSMYYRLCEHLNNYFFEEIQGRIAAKKIAMADHRGVPAGAVEIMSTKIVPLVQLRTKKGTTTKKLANPMCRVTMKFTNPIQNSNGEFVGGQPGLGTNSLLDKKRPFINSAGARVFEPLQLEGKPVNAFNVHLLPSGLRVWGIINMSTISFSSVGAAWQRQVEEVVIEPRVYQKKTATADDLLGDDAENEFAALAAKGGDSAAASAAEDLDDMFDDLAVTE